MDSFAMIGEPSILRTSTDASSDNAGSPVLDPYVSLTTDIGSGTHAWLSGYQQWPSGIVTEIGNVESGSRERIGMEDTVETPERKKRKGAFLPEVFLDSEMITLLREDLRIRMIMTILAQELTQKLRETSKFYVIRAFASADPEEEAWTRYVFRVDLPESSWEDKMKIWRILSSVKREARAKILEKFNASPRTRTLEELENVKIHINLSR